ncbi:EAL domain-containing protein [Ancylobacter sp. 6x-1]|uniref:EAL domain-containing protein n=1 Tax=Ancylobacter crimeensis TaxID=2579147 RepID=A0ABT0DFU9_9HYPH|nr:EAL domain-containing protein [Ancylobacter crimeensis]MCK0198744.1 EAL domain-containing protein [Ancylobacter crimeensis]
MLTLHGNSTEAFAAALSGGRVRPHFQPIIALREQRISAMEVLARWHEPGYGMISPTLFIPLAERSGLIDAVMESLMRQAFDAARNWPEHLALAFNVSPLQLRGRALPERIASLANEAGFPLSRLEIEITETAIIEDVARAEVTLNVLHALGCSIALDDFGTGYSSLAWLQTLPFDKIKIDASFVRSMMEQRQSRKIVAALVGLGQSLELDVVAEGVETAEEADFLRRIGCSHVQGYFFGRPVPAAEVPERLATPVPSAGSTGINHASLEQRAAHISALYRAPETSIGFIDTAFTVVDASEAFARCLGRPLAEVVGRSIHELTPREGELLAWLRSFRERGKPYPSFEFPRPDGGTDLVTLTRVTDEAGELLGYGVLGVDITDRKRADDALRESEEHYRLTAQLSMRICWQLDPEGKLIAFDDARYGALLGTTTAKLLGYGWFDLVHPDDLTDVLAALRRGIATGEVCEAEMRYRMADGSYRWVRGFAAPEKDADGHVVRWFGQTEDIHERRQAEDALRRSEREVRFILENGPSYYWTASSQGVIERSSAQLCALTGKSPEELTDDGWMAFVHSDDQDRVFAAVKQARLTGETFDMDYRLRIADGSYRWVRGWCAALREEDGSIAGWYGTITPILPPRVSGTETGNEERPAS